MKSNSTRFRAPLRIITRRHVTIGILIAVVTMFAGALLLLPYARRAQAFDLSRLDNYDTTSIFYDRRGEEIGRLFVENRILLSHEQIPDLMRQAIIAAEDRRFYTHHGIDWRSIFRACWINLKSSQTRQGGSTITQQLAKHLIGNFQKTLDRKIVEAFLARRIEDRHSKSKILDYYLNRIYFGRNYFGLESAAQGYFGKHAHDLTAGECALLAGIVRAPNSASPRRDLQKAIHRRDVVISKMTTLGMLSASDGEEARTHPITIVDPASPSNRGGIHSYFMAWAVRELTINIQVGDEDIVPQGLRVHTTLDLAMQRSIEKELEKTLSTFESELPSSNTGPLQGAVTVVDSDTGALRVLLGGRNFDRSPFDRATMAHRDNGAILQPFLYALSFERLKLHPASAIALPSPGSEGEEMGNSESESDPDSPVRTLTIQEALRIRKKTVADGIALRLGVSSLDDWMAKALDHGKVETGSVLRTDERSFMQPRLSLLELASLYQILANGGVPTQPYAIESVWQTGIEVFRAKTRSTHPLIAPSTAQQTTLMLQEVNYDRAEIPISRRGSLPTAAMSSASAGCRDGWFVGFTPSQVVGVWLGFDSSIPLGSYRAAQQKASDLWSKTIETIPKHEPVLGSFPVHVTLQKLEVNRRSGHIEGFGFWTPGAGNTFVHLTPPQVEKLLSDQTLAKKTPVPLAGASWLSTVLMDNAPPDGYVKPKEEIPPMVRYRIPALRGEILTSEGKKLATSSPIQNLLLPWPGPETAKDASEAVKWMSERLTYASLWLGKDAILNSNELALIYQHQRFKPLTVAESLSPQQVKSFTSTDLASKGFVLQASSRRNYPSGTLFSHGLGFLQRTQTPNRRFHQADGVVADVYKGASGLEQVYNTQLSGKEGVFAIRTTTEGFLKQALIEQEPEPGLTVVTTLRGPFQAASERALQQVGAGAAVILDVHNGDVLAMASQPDFNPNSFIPALSSTGWQSLANMSDSPLMNRVCQQRHPPGSAFKVITSLAAMRAGVFDPKRVIHCHGYFQVGNIHYDLPRENGDYAYEDALARSVNTYFMDLGLRTGREALINTARELGLGQLTGIGLPNESPGLMPTPDFVLAYHKRNMGAGDVANSSIGQGDVLVTPIQMANWMAAIANTHTLYKPRLVSHLQAPDGKILTEFPNEVIREISFPPFGLSHLERALVAVTERGTATAAKVSGISIAAKTGTAQVGSKARPRQVAWISGYLPASDPQYAFAIMIEGGWDEEIHGGSDAGHLAHQIFSEIFGHPVINTAKEP